MVGCGLPIAVLRCSSSRRCFDLQAGGYAPLIETAYRWALIGRSSFEIAFYFDRLSAVMALIVTGVGSVIHVYSVGYMAHDKSFGRFFAYLNLFLFFMLLLVLGRSLLVLFVGWEGVGLASYLLIGFWFDDLANARAGKKAFVANRIGDAGFLLGMFLLYQAFGTLDMDRINAGLRHRRRRRRCSASLVGILLFIGATGKSAQIPLHVWLPDAMAGPTPVSALIHAATMVTAGVYLVARMSGVYLHAPEASAVIAVVGVATAFFAATIAIVQTDIKKVLAYSTVSQLGLHVPGARRRRLRRGDLPRRHARLLQGLPVPRRRQRDPRARRRAGHAQDGRAGASSIPVTFWTFAIATAAIAGIPPLAGFFSKDEILWFAFASTRGGSPLLWARGRADRADDRVLHVPPALADLPRHARAWTPEVEHHVHESPLSMTGVLVLLALLSAVGGFIALPHFLEPQLPLPRGARGAASPARRRCSCCRSSSPSPAWPAPRSSSAAAPARADGLQRALRRAAPLAVGQVLHRRVVRARASAGRWSGCRTASSCAWATARCSTARCTAWPRSASAAPAVLGRAADRQPAPVRLVRAGRHRRRAALELAPCLRPSCSTSCSSCRCSAPALLLVSPTEHHDFTRRLTLGVMIAAVRAHRLAVPALRQQRGRACSSRRACRGSQTGACTTRSASTATTSCWSC